MASAKAGIKKNVAEDGLRGAMKDSGKTAAELDAARRRNMAYEYLCHLEEAKKWIEACLKSELPPASELEEGLRNGVIVARLAMFFAPEMVKQRQIYDFDEAIYKESGLRFRHTDNISRWTNAMRSVKFPDIFYPEVTDLYDKKNMPRVIYCIHALSRYLYQLGIAPKIQNLHGIAQFTDEEIHAIDQELEKAGVQMPTFGSIDGVLAKELGSDIGTADGTLQEITAAVEANDEARLIAALHSLATGFQHVDDALAQDYMARLRDALQHAPLTQDSVQGAIDQVNTEAAEKRALDAIRAALAAGDGDSLLAALKASHWDLPLDSANGAAYVAALRALDAQGKLRPDDIRAAIAAANAAAKRDDALKRLNASLEGENPETTFAILREPVLALQDVDDAGAMQYHDLLKTTRAERGRDLLQQDVQEGINSANETAEENAKHAAAIFSVHEAVRAHSAERTLVALQNPHALVSNVNPSCSKRYLDNLVETLNALESAGPAQSKWRECHTDDGRTYYFNKEANISQWVAPLDEVLMDKDQIQEAVNRANMSDARWQRFVNATPTIVLLQARIRGALARAALRDRLAFFASQEKSVVKIQANTRGLLARRKYQDRLKYFRDHLPQIVRIQAAWKGLLARRQYKNLTKVGDPPVATVRRFLHLLDQSDADLAEELAVQQLKEKVIVEIKHNVQLDQDLNQMDIKIGLLIKNRIALEDVVRQAKILKRQQRNGSQPTLQQASSGITALNKESRHKLQSYEHLFYLLQTQPIYLARLIFVDVPLDLWSATKAQSFLQRVTETVYNYASNDREQYLLFKLFRTALFYEVDEKITSIRDFIAGNPTVVKLVMAHHRGSHSDSTHLKATLGPFARKMIEHDEIDLNTNPIEVYKAWLMKQEAETGQKSALPYDVTREVALEHAPVRGMVDSVTKDAIAICNELLDNVINSLKLLPFGLRSICHDLSIALRKRFPTEPDDDILKCVGNILYYRYMNPAVIAPDAFDVIQLQPHDTITPVTRGNLGHVAKLMQMAASGQLLGDGSSPLDLFLREAWVKFRAFFVEAINVESLEDHFHVDEYSEVVLKSRPAIVISYHDMYYVHKMIAGQMQQLAPTDADPLRVVIADLGPLGEPVVELGEDDSPQFLENKAEMSLTLVNKFEVPEQEDSSVKALFIRTKRLLVDLIRFKQGPNLPEILRAAPNREEEEAYAQFVLRRKKEYEKAKRRAEEDSEKQQPTPLQTFGTLAELQTAAKSNVDQLAAQGLAKVENSYQDLLNAIAQDIRNQRMYRKQRREELARLNRTLGGLRAKQALSQQTIGEYENYVGECMKHMGKSRSRNKGGMFKLFRSSKPAAKDDSADTWEEGKSVKYSAARLKEKGVIVSVEGASDTQLRHVTIEITSAEKGVFEVSASAMFSSSKEEVLLQDLLQQQYQNIPTIRLFDNAVVVNVNLLLFLINKKFLGGAK